MKQLIGFLLSFQVAACFAQKNTALAPVEDELSYAFGRISYWYRHIEDQSSGDSLAQANRYFEQLLLHHTHEHPATISFPFKRLVDNGLIIVTSEDSALRIYSWNTLTGGSMRFYRNVFQYRNINGTYAIPAANQNVNESIEPGFYYHRLNKVETQGSVYYLAQRTMVGSSALTYHQFKVFSIQAAGLNDTAKLIKTKSGIRNELGYEVDFSSTANSNKFAGNNIDYSTHFDASRKIMTFPLLNADGSLTNKKIRYRFNGKYFVKLNP